MFSWILRADCLDHPFRSFAPASCQGATRVRGVSVPTCYSYCQDSAPSVDWWFIHTLLLWSPDLWTSLSLISSGHLDLWTSCQDCFHTWRSLVIDLHDLFCVFLEHLNTSNIILHHHPPDIPAVPSKMYRIQTYWKFVVHRCSIFSSTSLHFRCYHVTAFSPTSVGRP